MNSLSRSTAFLLALGTACAATAQTPPTTGQQTAQSPQPACSSGTGAPGCDPIPQALGPHTVVTAAGATETCTADYGTVRQGSLASSTAFPRNSFACPQTDQFRLLDNRYPPAGVFINYVSTPPNTFTLESFISKVHNASPSTQVNIMVSEDQLSTAQSALGTLGPATRIIPTRAGVSLWAQDTHEFGVTGGRPAVLDLPSELERGEHIPRTIAESCMGSRMEYVRQPCLTGTSQYCHDHLPPRGQRQPGDLLCANVSGPDMGCGEALAGLAGVMNGRHPNAQTIARMRADIGANYPSCTSAGIDISITRTSAHSPYSLTPLCCPDVPPTADDNFGGNIEGLPGGLVMMGTGIDTGIVNFLQQQGNEPVIMESEDFLAVGHVDELFNVIPTNHPAPCNFTVMVSRPRKGIELLTRELTGGRGDDAVGASANSQTVEELVTDRDFLSKNYLIDSFIEQDEQRLVSRLNARSGCTNVPVVEMPILLSKGTWTASQGQNRDIRSRAADRRALIDELANSGTESILPNMTNSVSIGTTQIMPHPQFEPFRRYAMDNLTAAGATPDFIRDSVYHSAMGEIHCGSNVVRTCSPTAEAP